MSQQIAFAAALDAAEQPDAEAQGELTELALHVSPTLKRGGTNSLACASGYQGGRLIRSARTSRLETASSGARSGACGVWSGAGPARVRRWAVRAYDGGGVGARGPVVSQRRMK